MSLGMWLGVALLAANLAVLALALLAAARRTGQRVPPAHPRRINGHGG